MCALKALNLADDLYDMKTVNMAATDAEYFMKDVSKFQSILKHNVNKE